MSFQELLATVNKLQEAEDAQLAKSQDATDDTADDKIAAAAGDNADADTSANTTDDDPDNVDGDPDGDDGNDGDGDGDGDGDQPMTKSFSFTLEDGTVIEAEDGTELVKSLIGRMNETESATAQVLSATVDLVKAQSERLTRQENLIKSQAAALKDQADKIAKLGNSGRGRASILSVSEKIAATAMTKSRQDEAQPTGREILAKAKAALSAGKITGMEAIRIETSVNQGVPLSADELAKLA